MRHGSLFSGYLGLDMAAQTVLGGSLAWVSDIDPGACKILACRAPDVPNLGDITAIDWAAVEPVDVMTGGYPCQPFSGAGKRKGTDDERHLWPYVREAIRHLRPRVTILENVAGHRSMGFDRVLGDMAEDGMHVRWTSLRASDVGACHGRERLFIIVTDPARDGRNEGWPEPARLVGRPDASVGGATPADALGRGCDGRTQAPLGGEVGRVVTAGRGADSDVGWGQYVLAIRRWEHSLGRRAPSPTVRGPKGTFRLSPIFVEWMMGLPAGWVTDVPGLSRNDQLRALGNGVVAAQAEAAIRYLLDVTAVAA